MYYTKSLPWPHCLFTAERLTCPHKWTLEPNLAPYSSEIFYCCQCGATHDVDDDEDIDVEIAE